MRKTKDKNNNFQKICLAMAIIMLGHLIYGPFTFKKTVEVSGQSNISSSTVGKSINESKVTLEESSNMNIEDNEKEKIKNLIQGDKNNLLSLVNENNPVADKNIKNQLVIPNVDLVDSRKNEKNLLRKEAAKALEDMLKDAKDSKVTIYLSSGYRSKERQIEVYNAKIYNSGDKNQEFVAKPGHSEHQTGLAVDLTAKSVKFKLVQEFENTTEGKWLYENAYKYGYILRYPKDKTSETGYAFEPWHFRYVGKEVSAYMKSHNLTLEKLYENLKL